MKLSDLLQKSKVDWTNFFIEEDERVCDDTDKFDISSKDFLNFAKKDYKCLNKQGMINALCNAKRAIDCQVDWILDYLGYEYLKFSEEVYPNIKNLITEFELENGVLSDTSFKLKFLQAMEISPAFLLSKIRLLRNKLEHEYTVPKVEEVKEALEVAELFINATKNVVYSEICHKFMFSSNFDNRGLLREKDFYYVDFDLSGDKKITVELCNSEREITKNITSTDEEYVFLIKAMVSHDFSYLPKAFGKKIDNKYIKYCAILMGEKVMFP